MPKKHRVKRQKYVQHLLKLEKQRDAYLVKCKNAKRNRQGRLAGEIMGDARQKAEVLPPQKRHRTEDNTTARTVINKDICSSNTSLDLPNNVHRQNNQDDSSKIINIKKEEVKIGKKDSAFKPETVEASDAIYNITSSTTFFSGNAKRFPQNDTSSTIKLAANNNDERKIAEQYNRVKKIIKRKY